MHVRLGSHRGFRRPTTIRVHLPHTAQIKLAPEFDGDSPPTIIPYVTELASIGLRGVCNSLLDAPFCERTYAIAMACARDIGQCLRDLCAFGRKSKFGSI